VNNNIREDSEELKFLYRVKEFVETVLKGRIEYAKGDELMSDLYDREESDELMFLRELLSIANAKYESAEDESDSDNLRRVRANLYRRIQEVEMRDWNI